MGMMKQLDIARRYGAQSTLYGAMKAMGIPLTERQAKAQEYLERKYGVREVRLWQKEN